MSRQRRAERSRSSRRKAAWPLWVFVGIGLVLVASATWIGVRGALAVSHLQAAKHTATSLTGSVDGAAVSYAELDAFRGHAHQARALTTDTIWAAARGLPWIGPQLHAVGAVAASVDILADEALDALLALRNVSTPAALAPRDGQFDVTAFAAMEQPAATAAEGLGKAAERLESVDTRRLIGILAAQLTGLQNSVTKAAGAADALARTTRLAPAMLGAGGAKNYLLLTQNNAEWRSLGGIPGAVALVHVEDGRITMLDQAFAAEFPNYAEPIMPLDNEVAAVYGDKPGQWMQNVTQVASFSDGAQLAQAMWERERGLRVDGVVSVDPVALSYLLAATGPLALPTGDVLSSDNAVSLLLNEAYFRYPDPSIQNAFFASVTSAVLASLTGGAADPVALVAGLSRAAGERRLLIWNADPAQQALVAGTSLAGELPVTDADTARFGVYLNDGTGSKIDYYINAHASTQWLACGANATAQLTLTLRDDAPPPEQLPDYITGGGANGVPAGIARTLVYVYLPEGYELLEVDAPQADRQSGGIHDGRRVVTSSIDLQSGQEATVIVTGRGPGARTLDAELTPTVNVNDTSGIAATC